MIKIYSKDIALTCFAFLTFLVTVILIMSWLLEVPLSATLDMIQIKLYRPHYNIFEIHQIGSINPLLLLYFLLILTALVLVIIYRISLPDQYQYSIPKIIFLTYLLGILTIAAVNLNMRFNYFKYDMKLYQGKSLDEKNFLLNHEPYLLVEKTLKTLSGRHQGKFITEENILDDPHMTTHRILSYYLYPTISLRLDNKTPEDVFIYYKYKSPQVNITDDQEIISLTEDSDFILTIKKKAVSTDVNNF